MAFGAAIFLAVAHLAALPQAWRPLATSIALGGLVLWALGSTLVMRQALTMIASVSESPPGA
jgi:hypothetical protein